MQLLHLKLNSGNRGSDNWGSTVHSYLEQCEGTQDMMLNCWESCCEAQTSHDSVWTNTSAPSRPFCSIHYHLFLGWQHLFLELAIQFPKALMVIRRLCKSHMEFTLQNALMKYWTWITRRYIFGNTWIFGFGSFPRVCDTEPLVHVESTFLWSMDWGKFCYDHM